MTLSFARHFELDPLRAERLAKEGHASLTLNQEKLVPPPPLPPSLFIGTERVDLETADRDWSKLSPEFTQAILKLFARMEKRGFPLALLEGYRSPQRQDNLASMGGHVTHARAYQSKHQFGLAADIAPLREGKLVISERDPWAFKAYQALGEEAEAMELGWGGLWAPRDLGHIETSLTLAEIKKQKGFPA